LKSERIIIGIDPGTNILGYGIILCTGNKMSLIEMDVLKLGNQGNHALKLKAIFEELSLIIDKHHPDELAIEAPFFGKNVQSMLKLGRAQGVAMAVGLSKGLPIFEYAPKKIKQSITGKGNASKEQVASMLLSILKIKEMPKYLDATDGLAAAVCHYFQRGKSDQEDSYSGWKSFITKNPERTLK
jgi:crossover junction endodeoxyribonuclease RuvC